MAHTRPRFRIRTTPPPQTDGDKWKKLMDRPRTAEHKGLRVTYKILFSPTGTTSYEVEKVDLTELEEIKVGRMVILESSGEKGVITEIQCQGTINVCPIVVIRWFDGMLDFCYLEDFTSKVVQLFPCGIYGGKGKLRK